MVRKVQTAGNGDAAVHVTGLSELVRNRPAVFLHTLDTIEELRPEQTLPVVDTSAGFRRTRLYLDTLLRRTPPTDDRLYAGHRGAMRSAPYQLVPAQQALQRPRPRLLIADGVGLGKTIEVGILLSELIRRGRGARILVVALKSILSQFQRELWSRFTIPLVRLDSRGLERVQAQLPSSANPFYYYDRVIISIDTLKKDAKYRKFLEHARWDAIVIDECQNVAVRGAAGGRSMSDRARLARLLAHTTDSLVLTSATPHDGRPESFASLIDLLDPTVIADPAHYDADDVRPWFVRRFKKDIGASTGDAFREREVAALYADATPAEQHAMDALRDLAIPATARAGGMLFRTTLLKALLSSPNACADTVEERAKRLRRQRERLEETDPKRAAIADETTELDAFADTLRGLRPSDFAKLGVFLDYVRGLGWTGGRTLGRRVVVFSERLATLDLLRAQLHAALDVPEDRIGVFWGTLDDEKQQQLVQDFGTENGKVRILLCSDAASEGINLHYFCHDLVHFDVPWSLITLEQRNGRIDRYGQQHTPQIRYLLTRPADPEQAGDLRVLERLIAKEQHAHANLGDAATLLGLHDAESETEHVAQGIEAGAAPEVIIPDAPTPDELLRALLGESGDQAAERERNTGAGVVTADPLGLFDDDLEWARLAFAELRVDAEGTAHTPAAKRAIADHAPEWLPDANGFRLLADDDLRRRLHFMPPDLIDGRGELRLTTDRQRVMDALEAARQGDGGWPEWQLFWEQHPVAEWLGDRVLGMFTRHEAPVVPVASGLPAGTQVFVVQGVISNKRSQPVLVDWFGVRFDAESPEPSIVPLDALVDAVGLDAPLPNPDRLDAAADAALVEALQARIPDAVEHARAHMVQRRAERASELKGALKTQARALKEWATRGRERVQAQQDAARAKGRNLTTAQEAALTAELRHIDDQVSARHEWIEHTLTTSDLPYLRLAAILAAP